MQVAIQLGDIDYHYCLQSHESFLYAPHAVDADVTAIGDSRGRYCLISGTT